MPNHAIINDNLTTTPLRTPSLSLAERQAFLQLSLEQRRRIMAEQAEKLVEAYADHAAERQSIQGGDIAA